MICRGPAYNVEPEIKDMESVLSTVPQEKISCKLLLKMYILTYEKQTW